MTDDFNLDDSDDLNGFDDFRDGHAIYTVDDAIDALKDNWNYTNVAVSYGLSDISQADADVVRAYWYTLAPEPKQHLMAHLIQVSEVNFELNYRTLAMMATEDPDDIVRRRAIEMLWEDETQELLDHLIKMSRWDNDALVRAAAASGLGRFILLGEYGELKPQAASEAQETAIQIWNNTDEDIIVRRRALEAISNCTRDFVVDAITEAYHSADHDLIVSSIYAMGRSCDASWESIVLKELSSANSEIRYEAAKASGELQLKSAIPTLRQIALYDERDIQEVAVWSLGEIGGNEAISALNILSNQLDETEWSDALDEAIENANLGADMPSMFNFLDDDPTP